MIKVVSAVVTFRYTTDNIELLLIDQGDVSTHPYIEVEGDENIINSAILGVKNKTGLDLLVISIEPIYEDNISFNQETDVVELTIKFFAGIVDPNQNVCLADDNSEYLWVDHLGGRNALSKKNDIIAYENARDWLYDNDEAALFLANYLERLQL